MAIVSFKHNFIFLKTAKTAGTSVEVDLSPVAGSDAVVTPILPPEPGHHPRNYAGEDGEPQFYNHMTAAIMRDALGASRFDSMFKFCIEREPVSKCISRFHMLRNSKRHNRRGSYKLSWEEFVQKGIFPIDVSRYAIDGDRVIDRILRYDELPYALENLMRELDVPDFKLTTNAKSTFSQNVLITQDDVTDAQKDIIYEAFAESIELSGIDWSRAPRTLEQLQSSNE
ncbi:MAG: hypothetical protein JXR15_03925 [Shimia sp.]|uniref:hypothetical protein n=1 Tax=Shimia sp. TaxID=1954381 RepID=UPI003B8DE6B4